MPGTPEYLWRQHVWRIMHLVNIGQPDAGVMNIMNRRMVIESMCVFVL